MDEDPADSMLDGQHSNPNARGSKKRGRGRKQTTKYKLWNNNTTSLPMQEYDALRDPHCRFTKQKQFKRQ